MKLNEIERRNKLRARTQADFQIRIVECDAAALALEGSDVAARV